MSLWFTLLRGARGNASTPPPVTTFSGAKVTITVDQVIAAGGAPVTWHDPPLFDTDGFWSAGSPTLLTVPATAKYVIGCSLFAFDLSSVTPGDVNDVLITNTTAGVIVTSQGDDAIITLREFSLAVLVDATAGDAFNVGAGFVNGGTINADPANGQASFWIFRYT